MHTTSLYYTLAGLGSLAQAQPTRIPLLTAISNVPDLSTFYSLFEGTGGESGKPGPDFEERFNDPEIGILFTAFAPTNEALARLPPGLITSLTLPCSYDLLKEVLLTHIAPGNLSNAELEGGKTVETIGGFTATFDHDGKITTNTDLHTGQKQFPAQASLVRTSSGELDCTEAYNGRICKIDGILDGFLTYFGETSGQESKDLPAVTSTQGTMRDIIEGDSEFSVLLSAFQEINPAFLDRLNRTYVDAAKIPARFYLAPVNAAFEALPNGSFAKLVQPSNTDQSLLLLEFSFGNLKNDSHILSSQFGFQLPIEGSQAANARITDRICAGNGCVWKVDRLLDPLLAV